MSQDQRKSEDVLSQLQRAVVAHKHELKPDLALPIFPERADRLLGVLEAMGVWVCEYDNDARLQYVSPQCEAIVGFTPEECLASDVLEFHPDDLHVITANAKMLRQTGEIGRSETRIRHKLGHWVWVETSMAGWYETNGGDFHSFSFVRDLSALKWAEAAGRENEARYMVVAQMSSDLIVEVNSDGQNCYVAPGCEKILGFTQQELLDMPPFALTHPEDKAKLMSHLASELEEFAQDYPHPPSEVHPTPLLEARIRNSDGDWLWFETLGLVYTSADGEKRYLAVSRDITARRLEEETRRELEENMRSAQKLESLGVLAGGIAHDFNNLLTPILGAAGLGLKEVDEDSPVHAYLQKIRDAAERAASLTDQMLAYAGQKPLGVEQVNLSKLVSEMHDLVASSVSGRTKLKLELSDDLPFVEAEAAQLSQVVMNLIINAAESLGDGFGQINVRTGVVDIDATPSSALFTESMEPGLHVFFEVADTGSGMDSETCARIFDPFFTTKFTGRGLGLAAVAGIVRGHRGAIEIESAPGQGTRFRILLPVSEASPIEVPLDRRTSIVQTAQAHTVLVIDDDDGVREIAREMLHRNGVSVLTAADGHEGIKLFELHADSIDVVLLDRTMPTLSGADTFAAIRAIRPDARVVLVSGYTEQRATADLAGRGLAGFLRKPFAPEALLTTVRDAFEG